MVVLEAICLCARRDLRVFDGTVGDCGGVGVAVLLCSIRDDRGDYRKNASVWRSGERMAKYDLCGADGGGIANVGIRSDWAVSCENVFINKATAGIYCAGDR